MNNGLLASLTELGLTGLEAEIYAQLLATSPLTGYALARQISKPTANTYKALDSLLEKGAVMMEYGKTRLYRAVPVSDLLAALEARHRSLGEHLLAAAKTLSTDTTDDRVYQVGSADQVLQQFRSMLERATQLAVFDLFPRAVEILRDDLERAARRGVQTVVKVYEPVTIPCVDTLMHTNPTTLSRWPGEWANGVIDGAVYQVAFLSRDCREVHLAIMSGSPYLAWIYHHGLVTELVSTSVAAALNENRSMDEVRAAHAKYSGLLTAGSPGVAALMQRFGDRKE